MTMIATLVGFLTLGTVQADPNGLVKAYRSMPAAARKIMIKSGVPDAEGNAGFNKKEGWLDVGENRIVAQALTLAIADQDEAAAEQSFKGIENTFKRINLDGTWTARNAKGGVAGESNIASANLFWLNDVVPALMQAQEWKSSYRPRVDTLKPAISRAIAYAAPRKKLLLRRDGGNANRLLIDARSFIVTGQFLGNSSYVDLGQEFLAEALKLQRPDGVFIEDGGSDTSYQGVSLRNLGQIYFVLPTEQVKDSFRRGSDWYLNQFMADGKIDARENTRTGIGLKTNRGHDKNGDRPPTVAMTLSIIAEIRPDSKAADTLKKFHTIAFNGDKLRPRESYVLSGK